MIVWICVCVFLFCRREHAQLTIQAFRVQLTNIIPLQDGKFSV